MQEQRQLDSRVSAIPSKNSLPWWTLQAGFLVLFYILTRSASFYLIDFIGSYFFSATAESLKQFHADQEMLIAALSILASIALCISVAAKRGMRDFLPDFHKKQAGMGLTRWTSIALDGLLKGLVVASAFLGTLSIFGFVDFDVSMIVDTRGFFLMLPSLLGQFLVFCAWVLALECLRSYLHHLLVRPLHQQLIGRLMLIGVETYFIHQAFSKPSFDYVAQLLLGLISGVIACVQLFWYEQGLKISAKEKYRMSTLRIALVLGFWGSLVFVYGAPLGFLRASTFISLLGGTQVKEGIFEMFAPDRILFFVLASWFFIFSANLVFHRLVRSAFRSTSRSSFAQSVDRLLDRSTAAQIKGQLMGADRAFDDMEFQS